MTHQRSARTGIIMGIAAVCLWATSSTCTVLGGKQLGVWQYLTLTSGLAGLVQIAIYAAGRARMRDVLLPPARLWPVIMLGFVLYALIYCQAIVESKGSQLFGVNLLNYLWPTLTVVFAVLLVPGTKKSWRLGVAVALALAGVLLASAQGLGELLGIGCCVSTPFAETCSSAASTHAFPQTTRESMAPISPWPYVQGAIAAVLWALYSAVLARWKSWAYRYATAPLGFLCTSAIAGCICLWTGQWRPVPPHVWAVVAFSGIGPCGLGYLLWERALHRAPASVLGLLGAATPVLSTVCLIALAAVWPQGSVHRLDLPHLDATGYALTIASAVLIAAAVVMTMRRGNGKTGY